MPFELHNQSATLAALVNRQEHHGDDVVSAVTLKLEINDSNTVLDALDPTLRQALYSAVPNEEQLPGVEPTTPLLRSTCIERVVLSQKFEGWTLAIDHGIDDDSQIKLGLCKLSKFSVHPSQGGSVKLVFNASSNDIDPAENGILFGKLGQELNITLTAPAKESGVIDGSVDAYNAERKAREDAGQGRIDELFEAGDEFARQHGSGVLQ
jgi:hypothetical protein